MGNLADLFHYDWEINKNKRKKKLKIMCKTDIVYYINDTINS